MQDPSQGKYNGNGMIEVKSLILYKTIGLKGAIPIDSVDTDESGQPIYRRRGDSNLTVPLNSADL
jgi:hypothetical protein